MSKPNALIIEDQEMLSTIFEKALSMADFDTEVVYDGRQALNRLAQKAPDLIILDLHLPKISGQDILQQIKEDKRLKNTKIVIATADTRLGEYLSEQVDVVLLKPIRFSHLHSLAIELHQQIN